MYMSCGSSDTSLEGYSGDTVRIQWEYRGDTVRIQWGYSEDTVVIQSVTLLVLGSDIFPEKESRVNSLSQDDLSTFTTLLSPSYHQILPIYNLNRTRVQRERKALPIPFLFLFYVSEKGSRAKSYSICPDFESLFLGPYISDNNISGIL